MKTFTLSAVALLSFLAPSAETVRAAEPPVSFNRDIRPILADACFHCHGPDPGSRKADLRLDREEGFFRHGGAGVVVRGKPGDSELLRRILATDGDEVMPPPKAHVQLKPAQKELIRRWIAEGAEWQPHWSFLAPARPELPPVKNPAWCRTPLDRFILAKLEAAGLEPAAEADAAALCRRVTLDLTGLPPTPEESAAFIAASAGDRTAREQAYAALVDRLLASPRYGEHRARYWLDAARYADTHGLHFDNYREMWPYRDWVVSAFNRNQPFDRFTIEQIAGDLLPNPTDEQRIATGFHRCNITTNEGGTIADENLAGYARDRVETTAWVWLGLTANCCVCHDHKFDPLTMRDFYSMSAFFRNTTQGSHDGNIKDTKPVLYLPPADDAARYKALPGELTAARDALARRRGEAAATIEAWQKSVEGASIDVDSAGRVLHAPLTEGAGDAPSAKSSKETTATVRATAPLAWRKDGKLGPAAELAGAAALEFGDVGGFERDRPFAVALWIRPPDKANDGTLLARMAEKKGPLGWSLYLQAGKVVLMLNSAAPKNTVRISTRNAVARPGVWTHLVATYDGSGTADGLNLYVNGAAVNDATRSGNKLEGSIRADGATLRAGERPNHADRLPGLALQDLRLYERRLTPTEVQTLAQLYDVRAAAAAKFDKRNPQQKARLATFYLDNLDAAYRTALAQTARLEDEQRTIQGRSVVTHVQEEKMNSPATANVLMRGAYDKPGEQVTPDVFAALNPLPKDAPKNRLGLAQWLVDRDNPLTARVIVNRFWQEVFGTGLVRTAEDFGIMGEAPSHPELLDWLAVEFREGPASEGRNSAGAGSSAWNVKALVRMIVLSSTYRQAAAITPDKAARDPENRLLSRGPRFRLDAEMIRDYALAAGGTLSSRMGGPGTKPYQPEGLWDVVGLPGGNTRTYAQDTGENLYRRSLYTFWKRMSPPPNMETFNAPSREFSCLRRERTNTPLQALVTLNDPQFVEASRNLAERVLKEGRGDPRRTLDLAARRVLCRSLRPDEAKLLEASLAELLSFYHGAKAEAEALVKVGESKRDPRIDAAQLAAWTNLCNLLLNTDEALNK